MPRYLTIPQDVEFKNLITKEPVMIPQEDGSSIPQKLSFREFFLNTLSNDPRFTTTKGARALRKFEDAYDAAVAKETGVMILDEEVWKEFREAAENPKHQVPSPYGVQTAEGFSGFKGLGVRQLLPLIDAIVDASDKEPEKKPVVQDADKAAAAG